MHFAASKVPLDLVRRSSKAAFLARVSRSTANVPLLVSLKMVLMDSPRCAELNGVYIEGVFENFHFEFSSANASICTTNVCQGVAREHAEPK